MLVNNPYIEDHRALRNDSPTDVSEFLQSGMLILNHNFGGYCDTMCLLNNDRFAAYDKQFSISKQTRLLEKNMINHL